jgi:hypothetical protein
MSGVTGVMMVIDFVTLSLSSEGSMEPISVALTKIAAGKAAETAYQLARVALKQADEAQKDDLRRLEGYVEAAQAAVLGLAQEREQILVEARGNDLSHGSRQELRRRIDRYLHTNLLRPQLETAKTGLLECATTFENRAGRFLQWPWKRVDRQEAVRAFRSDLASLVGFLDDLGDRLKYEGPSGIGVEELEQLYELLGSESSSGDQVESLITDARARGNRRWADQVARLTEQVERLRRAFR